MSLLEQDHNVASLLHTLMPKATLPGDVWIYIAENYLRKQDYLNLSQTARDIRDFLLPFLFRTLRFNGHITPTAARSDQSLQDCSDTVYSDVTPAAYLGYLQFNQTRIACLQANPHLLRFINSVELRNWAYIPPSLLHTPSGSTNNSQHALCGILCAKVLMHWLLTYQKLMAFVVKLPAIRTIIFHECEYGRGLHGDASPFEYTTILPSNDTLGGGYTACEWLHYSCENLSPTSFQFPDAFLFRFHDDPRITLRRKYLTEVLSTCQLPLIELRHTVVAIFADAFANWRNTIHSPEKLSALALTTDNIRGSFGANGRRLKDLFANCPNLISLELPPSLDALNDDLLPATLIPKLQSVCATAKVASQIIPGRPIHTIRIRKTTVTEWNSSWRFRIDFIQESTTVVKLLDVSGTDSQLLRAHLSTLLKVAPDLEVLLTTWSGSPKGRNPLPTHPQGLIYDILTALVSFRKLRIFGFASVPIDKDAFPTESKPLSFFMCKKYHPSLEVIYLGPQVQLIWRPGLGWINVFPTMASFESAFSKWQDNEAYASYWKAVAPSITSGKTAGNTVGEKVKKMLKYLYPKMRYRRFSRSNNS